jgi:CrcB protein
MSGSRKSLAAAVVVGGVIGSLVRWAVALALPETLAGLPWPTLFANITGSFVIGFYATLTAPGGRLFASARARQFVMTGFCGGYTTFSGFSIEILRLVQAGDVRTAAVYGLVSVASWLAAVWLGDALAGWIND